MKSEFAFFVGLFLFSMLLIPTDAFSENRFSVMDQHYITDRRTNLMWIRYPFPGARNRPVENGYNGIHDAAEKLNQGNPLRPASFYRITNKGYGDWEIANVNQLKTITDFSLGKAPDFPIPNQIVTKEILFPTNKVYIPKIDSVIVKNIYENREIPFLFVRGKTQGANNLTEKYHELFPEEMRKYLSMDKYSTFTACGGPPPFEVGPHLIPDGQDFTHLTFCPINAHRFYKLGPEKIKSLPLEKIIENKVTVKISSLYINTYEDYPINLFYIKGFYTDYLAYRKMDKFTLKSKQKDINTKLLQCYEQYSNEYDQFYNSTYFFVPPTKVSFPMLKLTADNYDIDKESIRIDFSKSKEDEKYYDFTKRFRQNFNKEEFPFPLLESAFPFDDAKLLFADGKPAYATLGILTRPDIMQDEFVRYLSIEKIICYFFNQNRKFFSAVIFHNFVKSNAERKGFVKYDWETQYVKGR